MASVFAKGYRVVPQRLWPVSNDPVSHDQNTRRNLAAFAGYRYLHIKEHKGVFKVAGDRDEERQFGKGKTIFVGNVDDQGGRLCRRSIADRLQRAFASCGTVVNVHVSSPDGGAKDRSGGAGTRSFPSSRFAHVSFDTADGVKAALVLDLIPSGANFDVDGKGSKQKRKRKREQGDDASGAAEQLEPSLDENGDETLGYAALIQRHRRGFPPREELQAEVDSTMERFEDEEAAEAARRKALLEQPMDDDGFVTVTYKKKRGRNIGNLPVAGDVAAADSGSSKKRKKGAGALPDFYRFQMRETRREQLVSLRTKFEQDKARVAKMKEHRKFKPF